MTNRCGPADQLLTTRKKVGRKRKLIFGPEHSWLERRRDGLSPRWMVAWYDPGYRTVRYRSTKTENLVEAKGVLAHFRLPENAQSLPPPRKNYPTQVYFIGGDVGAIKIGVARDIMRRLCNLQANSPIALRVLASGPGSIKDERVLHSRFAEHRLHGEWFKRHPSILAEIKRLRESACPPNKSQSAC